MKSRILTCITAMTLFAVLAVPVRLRVAAQEQQQQEQEQEHTRFKLIDIGTLGGPSSYGSVNAPGYQIISDSGVISAAGDTTATDPNAPNLCYVSDCFVVHATRWQNGVLTDLGALPGGGNSSASGAINARGWIAGQSQNGSFDPATGFPEVRATLWKDDEIIDLGTFGGNWSLATTLNDKGEVVGFASNAIPDPLALFLGGTQTRAFLWQDGVLRDLGTLGGDDAVAASVNQSGQVVGISYTNSNPNETTGIPTVHPFLWEHGRMIDLATLGGTYAGSGSCSFGALFCNSLFLEGSLLINNRGQVTGTSSLAGDQTFHPFLWEHGTMRDLGTLGGDNGVAVWLTEAGDVVGYADLPSSPAGCIGLRCYHGFLWKHGVMTDLGTLGTDLCSLAFMMNSKGQIVGQSFACDFSIVRSFLWENGSMVDLNTLIPANSGVFLYQAGNINEKGEIVASGLPPGCNDRLACGRLYLLIPCGEGDEGCEAENPTDVTQNSPALPTQRPAALIPSSRMPTGILGRLRSRWGQRYRIPGSGTMPTN